MSDTDKITDTVPPRRKRGRPRVLPPEQRTLSFQASTEQADQLDALLPRTGQRSAALREALAMVLARLAAEQAPSQAQTPAQP